MSQQDTRGNSVSARPSSACSSRSLREVSEMQELEYVHSGHEMESDMRPLDPSNPYDAFLMERTGQLFVSQATGPVEGRVVMPASGQLPPAAYYQPLSGAPSGRRGSTASSHTHHSHDDEGEFVPMDQYHDGAYLQAQPTPYHMQTSLPPSSAPHHMGTSPHPMGYMHSPMMVQSPLMHHQMMPNYTPTNQMHMQAAGYRHPRPGMQRHSTGPLPPRPGQLQRSQTMAGRPGYHNDVFGMQPGSTPSKRNMAMPMHPYEYEQQMFAQHHGISPARALGPAPSAPQRFSPHQDPMITPQSKAAVIPSSTSSVTTITSTSSMATTDSGSSGSTLDARRRMAPSSDTENDSPTKGPSASRSMMKMHIDEDAQAAAGPSNVRRPIIKIPAPKAVSGGRTSAKFAKVAEDPGVEGVPDGPKSHERPSQSFACIIGEAILSAKAGGLSLDHIYRYVETAYPFFGKGDTAWRNSVRHNLSIHKMFETIPRTEKFPPGKGGIWVIHEDELCHWPHKGKFIKNFASSNPHHHVCRQTLHEVQKEAEAKAKATAEGKVYVPKKGKKARRLLEAEGSGSEMARSNSQMSDGGITPQLLSAPLPAISRGPSPIELTPEMQHNMPLPPAEAPYLSEHDFADDGDFVAVEEHPTETAPPMPLIDSQSQVQFTSPTEMLPPPIFRPPTTIAPSTMVPPRFGDASKKRKPVIDEENVFTAPKKVRVAEPLAPIAGSNSAMVHDPDSYITPERERPVAFNKAVSGSSAFKTPALVNTSSSPGSSPMPPTIGRTASHNPSGLQQAWTNDDLDSPGVVEDSASPKQKAAGLESAFDLKPKAMLHRRTVTNGEERSSVALSPRGPPKTPLTRSSAVAAERTPFTIRSPFNKFASMMADTPGSMPVSTPLYDMAQTLARMEEGNWTGGGSPTRSAYGSPRRSPITTDPSSYAYAGKALASMMGGGMGSPISKGRAITTEPLKKA